MAPGSLGIAVGQKYLEATGFQIYDQVLDLADRWISRRRRWWALILPADVLPHGLQMWGKHDPDPLPGHLLRDWPHWDLEEEQNLRWDQNEIDHYDNLEFGTESRRLDLWAKIPTAVHSWGAALRPCPCGCRGRAFSESWLRRGGLRGFAIISQRLGCRRFPHPGEVSYWNAIPASYKMISPPRAALCMLGQIATPLQSTWVAAHVTQAIQLRQGRPLVTPEQAVQSWLQRVIQEAHDTWVTADMFLPRSITTCKQEVLGYLQLNQPATIQNLLEAEKDLQGHGDQIHAYVNGKRTSPQTQLRPDVIYELESHTKRQRLQVPETSVLTITGCGKTTQVRVQQGTFMQHIKQWLGLQFGEGLQLQGTPTRDGMRIWHDLHLEIKGAGYTGRQISDVAISGAMQALLNLDGALGGEPWVGLNPREALILQTAPESLIRNARPMRELLQDIGRALTIFEDAGHWALLAVQEEDGRLVATVYNGYTIMPASAENLLGKLAELWDRPTGGLTLHTDYAQTKPDQCGVIALQHTCRVLGLWDAFNEEITETWHDWLLEADTDESAWRAAGPEDKVMRDLAAVLIQQGVPGNKVEDRAAEAIKQIGSVQIQQALNQPNPWQGSSIQMGTTC